VRVATDSEWIRQPGLSPGIAITISKNGKTPVVQRHRRVGRYGARRANLEIAEVNGALEIRIMSARYPVRLTSSGDRRAIELSNQLHPAGSATTIDSTTSPRTIVILAQ
jgi:hypothetical protein